MGRPTTPDVARAASRMWVLSLLCRFRTELRVLNAQLTQPPEKTRPFKINVWPPPGTLNWARKEFEGALLLGRDPDNGKFIEPNDPLKGRYNLFIRVAKHVPYSEDWKFAPLEPYFRDVLPPVDYACLLIDRCLRRFCLCRMGNDAAQFANLVRAERMAQIREASLSALAVDPDPIHLVFLFALFHERQWHKADSPDAISIGEAFKRACDNFCKRDEFNWSTTARRWSQGNARYFSYLFDIVKQQGHRSPQPHHARFQRMDAANTLFCEEFPQFLDAELCVTMGSGGVPLWFEDGNAYFEGRLPTANESASALEDIFSSAAVSELRWHRYSRETPETQREAVNAFLSQSRDWPSPDDLLDQLLRDQRRPLGGFGAKLRQ